MMKVIRVAKHYELTMFRKEVTIEQRGHRFDL